MNPLNTPKFKQWFRGSIMVNHDGSPQVWYHGTGCDFDAFNPDFDVTDMGGRIAAYFTKDPEFASDIAINKGADKEFQGHYEDGCDRNAKGGSIIPVYLSLRRVWDYENEDDVMFLHKRLKKIGGQQPSVEELQSGDYMVLETHEIADVLKKANYDGFYEYETGRKNVAVFDPKRIKSIFNRGKWDKKHADIGEGLAKKLLSFQESRLGHVLIQFQDGLEWVRVSKDPDLVVLRSKELGVGKKGEIWSPKIEVLLVGGVLKKITGKVKKAYHKYLLALLLHRSVTGVALSENSDFKMSMFDDATLQEIDRTKPEFLGPEFRRKIDVKTYRQENITGLAKKINEITEELGGEYSPLHIEFDPNKILWANYPEQNYHTDEYEDADLYLYQLPEEDIYKKFSGNRDGNLYFGGDGDLLSMGSSWWMEDKPVFEKTPPNKLKTIAPIIKNAIQEREAEWNEKEGPRWTREHRVKSWDVKKKEAQEAGGPPPRYEYDPDNIALNPHESSKAPKDRGFWYIAEPGTAFEFDKFGEFMGTIHSPYSSDYRSPSYEQLMKIGPKIQAWLDSRPAPKYFVLYYVYPSGKHKYIMGSWDVEDCHLAAEDENWGYDEFKIYKLPDNSESTLKKALDKLNNKKG